MWVPAVFAAVKILVHLPFLGRYGYHHDELYFLACGRHPAWGYVDHPPLAPWLARLGDALFGGSLAGLRVFPLAAGAAAVFVTGIIARRLGGGRFAQCLACLGVLAAPLYLRSANVLAISSFEYPIWACGFYLVLRILQQEKPALWLWLGLVVGIGLLNKHSMLFFGFGLVAGLLLTPEKRRLGGGWPYAGGLIALLIFLPNLAWQQANGWPTVEFLRNLNRGTMSGISTVQFIAGQGLYLNPLSAPIWIAGLAYLFMEEGKRYRLFGWMYVSVLALLLLSGSKIYYLGPAYLILFAAGAAALEAWILRSGRLWLRPAMLSTVLAGGLLLGPVSLPVLPIDATETYAQKVTFGKFKNVYEITGDLRGQFSWHERLEAVARVWSSLDPGEREHAVIWARDYGLAGAIDHFGSTYGLPKAVSGHMTYFLWGLPDKRITTVVAAGLAPERMFRLFDEVGIAADIRLKDVNPWDQRFIVSLCRRPRMDPHAFWPRARTW